MKMSSTDAALAVRAANSALTAYIERFHASFGDWPKNEILGWSQVHCEAAKQAAMCAAIDAKSLPGADVLLIYDAAYAAATNHIAAIFDPTAEEMLAYERSIGQ